MRLKPGSLLRAAALIFDLDGTLVDSNAAVERVWRRWAQRHNIDAAALLRVSHGRRTIDTLRLMAPPDCDHDTECANLLIEELAEVNGIVAIPGAKQLLESLKNCRWAIVTSGPARLARHRLALTGLPVPKQLISANSVSVGKPDPEGYLLAARRLGVAPSETIIVEDAPAGLSAAHSSGAQVIAVATAISIENLAGEGWVEDLTYLNVRSTDAGEIIVEIL